MVDNTAEARPTTTEKPDAKPKSARVRGGRLRVGAIIGAAAAVAFVIWIIVDSRDKSTKPQESTAVAVSENGLKTVAAALGRPIYWAGARGKFTYELTKTPDERIYIRYLPPGVVVGEQKPALTVGTYPVPNAFDVTQAVANQKGSVPIEVGKGGVAFYSSQRPTNAYIAFPGSDFQIEVYDPLPRVTRQLVASGQIVPVAGGKTSSPPPTTGAVSISPKALAALAKSLKQPIYWAGSESDVTFELTRTPDGRTYIRYIPSGAKVGEQKPFLTIGTYPLRSAFAATQGVAASKGSVRVQVGTGTVAFYSRTRPTNIYLARQGEDFQVEVFDPSAAVARRLVASGRIRPVR